MGKLYFFQDSEDKGCFYGFPVRRGDTSNSNFDLDGFKSGEEDGANQLMVAETQWS